LAFQFGFDNDLILWTLSISEYLYLSQREVQNTPDQQ
jgi:hypothetical protein